MLLISSGQRWRVRILLWRAKRSIPAIWDRYSLSQCKNYRTKISRGLVPWPSPELPTNGDYDSGLNPVRKCNRPTGMRWNLPKTQFRTGTKLVLSYAFSLGNCNFLFNKSVTYWSAHSYKYILQQPPPDINICYCYVSALACCYTYIMHFSLSTVKLVQVERFSS